MIECMPWPRPRSARISIRSSRRTAVRLSRYCPSPPRCSRRATESSEYSSGPVPSWLSKSSSTSQKSAGPRFAPPAKRTSSGFSARSSFGLSDPAAQRIASETFDFPEPFGPTITPTPGSRRTSTGSGNDLKPRTLTARRCTDRRLSGRTDDYERGVLVRGRVVVPGDRCVLVGWPRGRRARGSRAAVALRVVHLEPAEAQFRVGRPLGIHARVLYPKRTKPMPQAATFGRSSSSASRAASCSAAFFEPPSPTPSSLPSTTAAQVKCRSCGGPSAESTV